MEHCTEAERVRREESEFYHGPELLECQHCQRLYEEMEKCPCKIHAKEAADKLVKFDRSLDKSRRPWGLIDKDGPRAKGYLGRLMSRHFSIPLAVREMRAKGNRFRVVYCPFDHVYPGEQVSVEDVDYLTSDEQKEYMKIVNILDKK